MRHILVFLFTIISFSAFNQITQKSYELLWQSPSFFYQGELKIDCLSFSGAQYIDSLDNIPLYRLLINEYEQGSEYRIINAKFKYLSIEENSIVNSNINLPNDFSLIQKIVTKNKKKIVDITLIPLRKNKLTSRIEKLISFGLEKIQSKPSFNKFKNKKVSENKSNSILRSGKWIKISVSKSGIHKVTFKQLVDMGIANPGNVGIWGYSSGKLAISNADYTIDDLSSNAIYFNKGNDGVFNEGDYLLFYAKSARGIVYNEGELFYTNNTYSDKTFYFLSSDHPSILPPVVNYASEDYSLVVNSFDDYIIIDDDKYNLIQSGSLWVGDAFDVQTSRSYSFTCPNLVRNSELNMQLNLLARSGGKSSFSVSVNNKFISEIEIDPVRLSSSTSAYAESKDADVSFFSNSDNVILNLEFNKYSASSMAWLNSLVLHFKRDLVFLSDQLLFRNNTNTSDKTKFNIRGMNTNCILWDVTNEHDIKHILFAKNADISSFIVNNIQHKEFLAFDVKGDFPSPEILNEIQNQNLHSLANYDMIIVSPPQLISQANRLADFHRQENISVFVVNADEIYNEFSSGAFSAIAIRNFMKMLYNNARSDDQMPQYLLLFGDGSYDNKSSKSQNNRILPSFQSSASLSPVKSFVSDDFFALLDVDEGGTTGIMDVGVGRLPISDIDQAREMVDKIISYSLPKNINSWVNDICFIADDEDNNIHMRDADFLASYIENNYADYNVKRLFLDDYVQEVTSSGERYPQVNVAIAKQMEKGALIINYTGHGNENGLAHERILTIDDINSWTNTKYPVFMTATCEFSRFDNYNKVSAGEFMLLKDKSGAIALFTTTRLVFSNPNFVLNKKFYETVFKKNAENNFLRLGDIMRLTKNSMVESVNKRSFTLLGDPAMKLNYPEYKIKINSIKDNKSNISIDTLKAFNIVKIAGSILNLDNKVYQSYDGDVNIKVYDKYKDRSTKANDGEAFNYKSQTNIIFNGTASVSKGMFTFTFKVPKDIMYKYGKGKISCYSKKGAISATGTFSDFIVGASATNNNTDNEGPQIELFLKDEDFVDGQIVNETPLLLALLKDESGINTIGNSVGHDISIVLNNEDNKKIILNDFYEADKDSFQSGKIKYNFSKLDKGEYTLVLKVWDTVNNSNDKKIEFIVSDNASLAISHLLNYPNPFTTNTSFYFEHNSFGSELDVLIQIFTVSGNLIKTIETNLISETKRLGPISWDGTDDYGNRIARGVYFYRLKIRDEKGQYAEEFQKIVLLK